MSGLVVFFFQAEDGIRGRSPSRGLGDVYKRQVSDPSCHDYSVDKPVWEEIANGHFVYGNQKELEGYRKEYQSQL